MRWGKGDKGIVVGVFFEVDNGVVLWTKGIGVFWNK